MFFPIPWPWKQRRDLFRKNPRLEAVPFYDTAGSVKHVVGARLGDAAAIASRRAAEVYGGEILKTGIEDDKRNFTRFFLLRRGKPRAARQAGKTSLAFSVKNVPGALFKALSVFALRDISLSKIESRPRRGHPWEYVFFVDLLAVTTKPPAMRCGIWAKWRNWSRCSESIRQHEGSSQFSVLSSQ